MHSLKPLGNGGEFETGQKFTCRKYQHKYDMETKKKENGIGDHIYKQNNWKLKKTGDADKFKMKLCTLIASIQQMKLTPADR